MSIGRTRALAFLIRSLRVDSRHVLHHVIRAAFAFLVVFMFLAAAVDATARTGAGGAFAGSVFLIGYACLTLLGGLHFCVAIVEEKEERTLGLLRMTGASSFAVLAGKSLPRLFVAVLLLAVAAPFLSLSVTLGGLYTLSLLCAIAAMLTYTLMLSQVGLLAGVVTNSAPAAFTLTILAWCGLEYLTYLLWIFGELMYLAGDFNFVSDVFRFAESEVTSSNWGRHLFAWLYIRSVDASADMQRTSLILNLSEILISAEPWRVIRPIVIFEVCVAAGSFVLSLLLFERCTRNAIAGTEGGRRKPAKGTRRGRRNRPAEARRPPSGQAAHAVSWKAWQLTGGGRFWFYFRLVGQPLCIVLLVFIISLIAREFPSFEGWSVALMGCGTIVLAHGSAHLLGKVINEEVYSGGLSSLLLIPMSTGSLLWSLVRGIIPMVLASASSVAIGFVLMSVTQPAFLEDFVTEVLVEPWFWHVFSWALLTLHLGVYFSVLVRHGAMLLALLSQVVLVIMMSTACGLLSVTMRLSGPGTEGFLQYVLPIMLIIAEVVACVFLQRRTVRAVEAKGSAG